MPQIYGKLGKTQVIEVPVQATHLPAELQTFPVLQVDIQVLSVGGSILYTYGDQIPATNGNVNTTNHPFLAGFTNAYPSKIGISAAPGDPISVDKFDLPGFQFCLMDATVPAWLVVTPRLSTM
ncbi:hypothetical protein [Spirosoma foliorum]|uniref:Uncharacterized protein n=1 Tax=Spirosoma foliorum TaxID=2710596 RepID=A0A7G5H2I0_9BACT|nr:hypothetical protein [Spirosoma foliorum]QMW05322.1 hypothetical protein H3H32_10755 [Spirosoma foliorum]